eukprot:TRINITY_DN13789_c0_g1_i2.p1 TRINITY_DN13789_c0_g1~~TRINITY_DN13789_c0_g1_i2.p1  ORF type:complete len:437 (-),score=118.37 TRINITY_DN13789_c0_g1_i2:81-1391(-)
MWGGGIHGRLGLGDALDRAAPTKVVAVSGRVVQVSCGLYHTACCTADGEVLSWGAAGYGQLGHGTTEPRNLPGPMSLPEAVQGTHVACGSGHSILLDVGGQLWSTGYGGDGQLGLRGRDSVLSLSPVSSLQHFTVVQLACGWRHSAAICSGGELFTWGWGAEAQLGHSYPNDGLSPGQVLGLPGRVLQVSCGTDHTACVIEMDPEAAAEITPSASEEESEGIVNKELAQATEDMKIAAASAAEANASLSTDGMLARLDGCQKQRQHLLDELWAAQDKKLACTDLELRMRAAVAEAHKAWQELAETSIDQISKKLSGGDEHSPTRVDLATTVQVAQHAVDEVVASFRQLMMAGDNAALVAAETHPDPEVAASVADFVRMLVEIIEDNGDMRKRVYGYTEALQRDTIEKAKQFEESMAVAEEPSDFERFGLKITSMFD